MARGKRSRSARRLRPGWRSLLVLLALLILGWLIGKLIGFRDGGRSSLAARDERRLEVDGPGATEPAFRRARADVGKDRLGDDAGTAPSIRPVADSEDDVTTEAAVIEGGFLRGPSWLRFRLPEGFDLDRTSVAVQAVHADLPGLAGRRILRATTRRAPDEIALLLDSVPGGVWIELGHEQVRELHGPFAARPFELVDEPRLDHPSERPALPEAGTGLYLTPPLRPLRGRDRPWSLEGKPDLRSGPITRPWRPDETDVLELRGPWTIRPAVPSADPTAKTTTILPAIDAVLVALRSRGAEIVGLHRNVGGRFEVPWNGAGDVHFLLPGAENLMPADVIADMQDDMALFGGEAGRLSLARELIPHLLPLRDLPDPDEARADDERLEEELLLFDLAAFPDDPEDPERVLIPLFCGWYSMVDLGAWDRQGIRGVGRFEIEADQTLRFEPTDRPPGRELVLRVVAAESGDPIAGARVVIAASRDEPPDWLPGIGGSDAEGRLEILGLPEGEIVVLARAPGREARSWRGRGARDGRREIQLALRLAPGLEVRCRDQEGRPVRPPAIAAVGADGSFTLAPVDEAGRALFPGLSPGRVALLAYFGGGLEQVDGWSWLESQFGALVIDHPRADPTPLSLLLPRPRPVRLAIRTAGHDAPERFDLLLQGLEEPLAPGLWLRIHEHEVGAGELRIDALPPGRYLATASAALAGAVAEFEVPDRDEASIPLTLDFDR
ncbi:MAG: carboxypeptidase regulatory-like domain-containing protein [Planctomycetes bacterium]|nr:carboxypeptidase regulatory-like domain-containing protein [Planctomycetota bacterium]